MGLKRATLNLSIINGVSILLGLIFHILLGRRFGISWELDCLFVSLLIFSFFGIFNNLLTSLLIPVFNEIKARSEREGFEFADVIFKWSLFIGLVVWLIVLNASPLMIRLVASGFDERAIGLSTEILKVLFVGYIFYNLSNSVSQILNALYLFFIPILTGLLHPVFSIVALFILTPAYGVEGIAIGYLVSNLLQTSILIPYLFIKTRWRPTLKIYHNKLPELLTQSSQSVMAGFIWGLRDIISRNIASHLGSGMIALLSYADKIISILFQIVVSPVSAVFYSKISQLIAFEKWIEIKNLLLRIMRVNIAISVFVSASVMAFLKPSLSLLFMGSKFTVNDIYVLSYLAGIELISIIIMSFDVLFVRIIYGIKRVNFILFNAIAGVILFYALSATFSKFFGIYGIALGLSITHILVYLLNFNVVNKYIDIKHGIISLSIIRNSMLAAGLIIMGLFVNSILKEDLFIIFLWYPIWVFLYMIVSRYILKDEWNILGAREA